SFSWHPARANSRGRTDRRACARCLRSVFDHPTGQNPWSVPYSAGEKKKRCFEQLAKPAQEMLALLRVEGGRASGQHDGDECGAQSAAFRMGPKGLAQSADGKRSRPARRRIGAQEGNAVL